MAPGPLGGAAAAIGGAQRPRVRAGQHSAVAACHASGLRGSGQGDSKGERDQQRTHGKLQGRPDGATQPEHVAERNRQVNLNDVERMARITWNHIGFAQAENMLACRVRHFDPAVFLLWYQYGKGRRFVRNALTRHLAALALTLGLLFTGMPARAEPMATAVRPADSLVQVIQYYGRPGDYGRHRFYGRPHHYYGRGFYGRPRYYGGPRFHGPRYGYYGRPSYIR